MLRELRRPCTTFAKHEVASRQNTPRKDQGTPFALLLCSSSEVSYVQARTDTSKEAYVACNSHFRVYSGPDSDVRLFKQIEHQGRRGCVRPHFGRPENPKSEGGASMSVNEFKNNDRVIRLPDSLQEPASSVSLEKVQEYIRASKAKNTIRGYQSDWRDFCQWCERLGVCAVPGSPETVATYIAECAQRLKVGSIQRRLNAITEAHKAMELESPTHWPLVVNTMKGIKRSLGTAVEPKAPALTEDIRSMLATADPGLMGLRDRALILLGFAGALRRSEVVGIQFDDLVFNRDGLTVTLRRGKTDQEGRGRKLGIPYGSSPETCPVRAVQTWLVSSATRSGPLFRSINRHGSILPKSLSGIDVSRIVKKLAKRAGLDHASLAGHSLRSGHATSAAILGASERSIMNQTGHQSVEMVRRYIREGTLFRDNSATRLGL